MVLKSLGCFVFSSIYDYSIVPYVLYQDNQPPLQSDVTNRFCHTYGNTLHTSALVCYKFKFGSISKYCSINFINT